MIYIFDFDGTLVDSMEQWSAKMLNILNTYGIEYPPDIIKKITPLGDKGAYEYFKEHFNLEMSLDEFMKMIDDYALPLYRDIIGFKDGSVPVFLKRLKASGNTLCVLTASPHKMLDPCLKRLGICSLFDHIWSCDDFGMTKSNPRIYLSAIAMSGGSPSDGVFFDDNIEACRTAKTAGLYTVGVYDKSGASFKEELSKIADKYIYSFDEFEDFDY